MADLRAYNPELVQDASQELGELNPANRLYRLPSGRIIKIKTFELGPAYKSSLPPQARVFRMTASMCNAQGQLQGPDQIGPPHMAITNLNPESPDHGDQLDETRRRWALWTEEFFNRHHQSIDGVVQLPD